MSTRTWLLVALCASGCVLPRIERWQPDGSMTDGSMTDGSLDVVDAGVDAAIVDTGVDGVATDGVSPPDAPSDSGVDTRADSGVCGPSQMRCDESCVSLQSDPNHCGSCGNRCGASSPVCSGGNCRPGCAMGEMDCGSGVCANLSNNTSHCGACGRACVAPSGGIVCSMGRCGISGCPGGIADCDGMFANGCEINTTNDTNNCGACGMRCAVPVGGSTSCVAGACRPMCPPGLTLDAPTMRCLSGCGATTECTSATDCPAALCGTARFAVPWASLGMCTSVGYGMASAAVIQDCTNAARAACVARGYMRGGWGPIGGNATTATIVCESSLYAPAPTTTVSVVVGAADGPRVCGPTSQWGNNCTTAIVETCSSGGFGTIELAGSTVLGVCYPGTRTTMIGFANSALPSACTAGMIPDLSRRSNGCLTRLAEECRLMFPGSIAGVGPVRDEGAPSSSFVWCLRPTI